MNVILTEQEELDIKTDREVEASSLQHIEINQSHVHELLDRVYMMTEIWDNYIINHPAAISNHELYKDITIIGTLMSNLYANIPNRFEL